MQNEHHKESLGEIISERIGFGHRLGATIVDMLIALMGGSALGTLFQAVDFRFGTLLGSFLSVVVGVSLVIVCNNLIEALTGATIGKMLVGIRVRGLSGKEAHSHQLWTRFFIKNIPFMFIILAGVTYVKPIVTLGHVIALVVAAGCFLVFGESKQAMHDLVSETAVYKK